MRYVPSCAAVGSVAAQQYSIHFYCGSGVSDSGVSPEKGQGHVVTDHPLHSEMAAPGTTCRCYPVLATLSWLTLGLTAATSTVSLGRNRDSEASGDYREFAEP
jgi:hypothetical protein